MTETPQPHVVMLVNNSITNDSRVQKTAVSVSKAGFQVTLLGIESPYYGITLQDGALFARVPIPDNIQKHVAHIKNSRHWLLGGTRVGLRHKNSSRIKHKLNSLEYRAILLDSKIDLSDGFATLGLRVKRKIVRNRLTRMRARIKNTNRAFRDRQLFAKTALRVSPNQWRYYLPRQADWEASLAEVVIELNPDIIHVNDPLIAPVGLRASNKLKKIHGKEPRLVYDSHEWWSGLPIQGQDIHTAILQIEKRIVTRADSVVTVVDEIADLLASHYDLPKRPAVIKNLPTYAQVPAQDRKRLRAELGLADETKLMVYSGAISKERGVETAVRALSALQDVHLAIVGSDLRSAEVKRLVELSEDLGVSDRVHLRPYVPTESIVWFLSTADIGISPLLHTENHHLAMPTKLSEYLLSGMVLVVSDCRRQAEFVTQQGVGEVFAAGDPQDFAATIRKVLKNFEDYKSRMDENLLESLTWESQEVELAAIYQALTDTMPKSVDVASDVSRDQFFVLAEDKVANRALEARVSSGQITASQITTLEPHTGTIKQIDKRRVRLQRYAQDLMRLHKLKHGGKLVLRENLMVLPYVFTGQPEREREFLKEFLDLEYL